MVAETCDDLNGSRSASGAHTRHRLHDARVAMIFTVFSEEVVPLYYERDQDGLPRSWIRK
jgi:starch phosphorylase